MGQCMSNLITGGNGKRNNHFRNPSVDSNPHHSEQPEPSVRPSVVWPSDPRFTTSINTRNNWNFQHVYSTSRRLGQGQFGTVYAARHREAVGLDDDGSKLHVAIKQTRPNILDLQRGRRQINTPDDLEQHCQEIKTLLRIREGDPLTCSVLFLYEYFMSGREVYIVTEILQQELAEYRTSSEIFTEHDAIQICRTILRGIEFLKSRNVVHRDLKLENILFGENGAFDSLKIADFGLSRVLEAGESTRDFCGTPGYISPEIYNGEPYQYEVDMFSFGVLLFRLLSGERPFPAPGNNLDTMSRYTTQMQYTVNGADWEEVTVAGKDLVRKLLINRDERLTVEQAIQHAWFSEQGESVLSRSAESDRSIAVVESRPRTVVLPEDGAPFVIDASAHLALSRIQRLGIYKWNLVNQMPALEDGAGGFICVEEVIPTGCVSLPTYVSRLRSYTERECRQLCSQLVSCIGGLHGDAGENPESRLAHRNLHMNNVIVDPQGNVSLKGLQHSQLIRDTQPLTGHFGRQYSNFQFKAPEVDTEFVHDKAVDLWSLGSIIYTLLTGVWPFRGEGLDLIEAKHLGQVTYDVFFASDPAKSLIEGLLRVQPEERFTIDEVLNSQWMIEADDYLETFDLSIARDGLKNY